MGKEEDAGLMNGAWQNQIRAGDSFSGKLKNPGKRFVLETAAEAARLVNKQRVKMAFRMRVKP